MPFTRLLAGTVDYHLGGFRAVQEKDFKMHFTNPLVTITRCHMLAFYVVLESYLSQVVDSPPSYEGQLGFDWIQNIPTVWDETRVPNAEVEEYVTIARKKNDEWWVGTINNHAARTIKIPLDFLDDGNYTVEMYIDAPDSETNPNHLLKQTQTASKKDVMEVSLAANGGAVMHFKKPVDIAKAQAALHAYLNETSPFPKNPYNVTNVAPFILNAADFDLGDFGVAFYRNQSTVDAADSQTNYRTDNGGIPDLKYGIINVGSTDLKGFDMTTVGDWYTYSVNVVDPGVYKFEILSNNGHEAPKATLTLDNLDLFGIIPIPYTGWGNWQWSDPHLSLYLTAGKHKLRYTLRGGFGHNVGALRFTFVEPLK
jgi:alpha-glucosidase